MKVRKETIQAAFIKLIDQITNTMPNTAYQFVMGGIATFASMKTGDKLTKTLELISDENGLVDVEALQQMVDGAFKASGNKLQLEFFGNQGLLSMFLKPITVTIQKRDIDMLMAEIRQNAVSNEVTITPISIQSATDSQQGQEAVA